MSMDPQFVSDVLKDILRVGEALGQQIKAQIIVEDLQKRIDSVCDTAKLVTDKPKVLCIEWSDPVMCGGHWIPEMIEMAGGIDCFGDKNAGSMQIEWNKVLDAKPDIIILMPCGFGVKRALEDLDSLRDREGWDQIPAVVNKRVFVVDAGSYTSRSGPRLVTGLEILAEIMHPEIVSGMIPGDSVLRVDR
jgi:iron complex transport system substrate-binding protein